MQAAHLKTLLLAMTFAAFAVAANKASAAIVISEVDSAGSANNAYKADWFELTNTGAAAVSISGWKMDDNSASFSSAVPLSGVTSINAGQTVVFIEDTGTTDATVDANFKSAWFGTSVPAALTLGNYGGSGVGLSQTSDAVNIFNASGSLIANVSFNTSPATGGTFDNTAGLNNVTLAQASVAGVNGAFVSLSGSEIGSPGVGANVAPVPLPAAAWLMLAGLGAVGPFARKKRAV